MTPAVAHEEDARCSAQSSQVIELRTFGGCDLRDSANDANCAAILSQPKRLALLLYLAIADPRGGARRDTLLALFWPDFDTKRARAALRRSLHFLGSALGEGVLVGRGEEHLGIDAECLRCDTRQFSSLLASDRPEAALELYDGELLPGFFAAGSAGFERWLDDRRSEFRRAAADAAVTLADRAERDRRVVAAAGWLRRALEIDPGREASVRRLMTLLYRSGDRAGALRAFRTFERRLARELDLDPAVETSALADSIRDGAEVEAPPGGRGGYVSGAAGATTASPGTGLAAPTPNAAARELYVQGQAMVERDRAGNEGAIERFREATRLEPRFAEAHAALAAAFAHQVELFGAPRSLSRIGIRSARRAIALDPTLPQAHLALGQNLETLRRLTDAAEAYRHAVELDPDFAPAIWALAQVSVWAGDFAGAVEVGERALEVMPGDPRPFFTLGLAYYCLDWPDEAEPWYDRALSIWPEFIWAEASLAYFRGVGGRPDEARPLIDRILARDPDNWVGITCAADHALREGDLDGARRHIERAAEIDPNGRHTGHLRSVSVALGFVLGTLGDMEEGAAWLERGEALNQRAIAGGTEFGGFSVDLAAVHALRGEPDEARRWLGRASERDGWRQFRFARLDPTLDEVRRHDWFAEWCAAMEADVTAQRERTRARQGRVRPP